MTDRDRFVMYSTCSSDDLISGGGFRLCGYLNSSDVSLYEQRSHELFELGQLAVHGPHEFISRQLASPVGQFANQFQALGMKRILGHMVLGHEQHPSRLMRHKSIGPCHGVGTDQRRHVVFTDCIQHPLGVSRSSLPEFCKNRLPVFTTKTVLGLLLDTLGAGAVKMVTVPSLDWFQAQAIWEISVEIRAC